MTGTILLALLLLLIVFWTVGAYSRLVGLRTRVKDALSQFGAQLQRRHELILALATVIKGGMQHDQEAADAVTASCERAMGNVVKTPAPADADAMQRLAAAEGILSSSLDKLFSLSEAHPAVHDNQDMMRLTEELAATENKIAFARQVYNDGASQYNASIEQIPGVVATRLFGFKKAALLPAILSL
jgi:LemA protein